MVAVNHYGGGAVVNTYPWGHYDCVVDVAGGVGGFMADVMRKVPGLSKGVVFDLASNINRAKEVRRAGVAWVGIAVGLGVVVFEHALGQNAVRVDLASNIDRAKEVRSGGLDQLLVQHRTVSGGVPPHAPVCVKQPAVLQACVG